MINEIRITQLISVAIIAASSCLTFGQNLDTDVRSGYGSSQLKKQGLNLGIMPKFQTLPKHVRIVSNSVRADYNKGQIFYDGMVRIITDNGVQIYADKALADTKSKLIHLQGNVQIFQNSLYYRGEKASYNYGDKKMNTTGMKVSIDPIIMQAEDISSYTRKGKTYYIGRNAGITTHDVEHPNYWMRSKKITIYPDNKVVFNNVKLYAGDTPIFWLPYLSQPLDKDLGYHFTPGGRSNWGPFLMNRYGMMIGGEIDPETGDRENSWLLAQWLFDIRALRGLGVGADFFDQRQKANSNLGWLKLYYANDLDPSRTRSGLTRGFVNEDRYRIEFKNRFEHKSVAGATFYTDVNLTWLSDRFYLEDFEPRTYTYNPQPDNTIGFFRKDNTSLAGIYTRIKLNDFYQTDSRLPEIFYEQVKRPVFNTNILHQGSTSLGFYREDIADFKRPLLSAERATLLPGDPRIAEIDSLLAKRDFIRFHTMQQFSRPFTPVDGITLTPKLGFGYTHYWNEGASNRNLGRRHFFAGIDSSMKFTRHFPNLQSKKWGINQLMHVVQPYVNLSVVSTNELDSSFTRIDRLTPTTRPRSIDVGTFSAIDDLNNWAIARIGVRNQLLTKRDGGSHPWLTTDTYLDYFFNDPELDRNFSNLYNDIYWNPVPWVALSVETQFPIAGTGSGFTEFATGLKFMPNENWEFDIHYRFLDNHPTLVDSNRIDLRAYTRLNEKWGFDFYQQYELDDNTLETQQYNIHRDFDSWIMSFGVLHRNNRRRTELSYLLSFTLKEFPSINVPLTIDQTDN